MKNLIKSRRGVAIEMAVGAMFIMIALSIVLISISGMQIKHRDNDLNEFNEKITLYEITDSIGKAIESGSVPEKINVDGTDYNVTLINTNETENIKTYEVTNGDSVILTLEIKTITTEENGIQTTTNTITSWGN